MGGPEEMQGASLLPFLRLAGQLKRVPRTGWLHSGVRAPVESVADHSWRVALMALTIDGGAEVDSERAVRMGLLHDIQEAIVGDIMPEEKSKITPEKKHALEREAVEQMVEMLP